MRQVQWLLSGCAIGLALTAAACSSVKGSDHDDNDDGNTGSNTGSNTEPPAPAPGPSAGGTQITINSAASLVAFQDGDSGAWTALPVVNNVAHATATGSRYAVVVTCGPFGDTSFSQVFYQTTADPSTLAAPCGIEGASVPPVVPINVQAANSPANTFTNVFVGDAETTVITGITQQLTVNKGMNDVFAVVESEPQLLLRQPSIDIEQTQELTVDVALAKPAELHPLIITGTSDTGTLDVFSGYKSAHTDIPWDVLNTQVQQPPYSYGTLAASMRQPGDLTQVIAEADRDNGQVTYSRRADLTFATPSNLELDLPPELAPFSPPSIDNATDPRLTVTIPSAEAGNFVVDYSASVGTGEQRTKLLTISASYAAGMAPVRITTPDLSALTGWVPAMALQAGQPLQWQVQRFTHDPGANDLVDGYHRYVSGAYVDVANQ